MVVGEVCTAERPDGGRGGTIEEDINMSIIQRNVLCCRIHSACSITHCQLLLLSYIYTGSIITLRGRSHNTLIYTTWAI